MVELLPCPFCGGTDCYLNADETPTACWVECPDCEVEGPSAGWGWPGGWESRDVAKAKAIELWNTRAVMHVKFTESNVAYTTINDQVFVPLTPRVQRLA